jgi:hypothetical protein
MIADMLQIRDLGWVAFDDGKPTTDGRWCVLLLRDPKEMILAIADTQAEAWSAARAMAVKLGGGPPPCIGHYRR